jgi:hypothetical protein
MSSILRTEMSAILDIDGTQFDVIQCGADFSINGIPTAEAVLAIGRKATGGNEAAAIHKAVGRLTAESICKLYFCPSGSWSDRNEWPKGPHLVFEGRLANVGYTKIQGKVQFVVRMVHWLADLNYSSAVSSISHPSNPAQYTFQSIISSDSRAGFAGRPVGIASTGAALSITAANVQADLWSQAIKPFFCRLANSETARLDADLKQCFNLEGNDNSQALAALKRIEGAAGTDCDLKPSCYTPPLSLSTPFGDAGVTVADAIAKAIAADSIQSFANTTLWAKLVGYTSTFGGAVIPLVNTALVIPFVPGLRQTYCKRIDACDYIHINLSQALPQALRGIALTGSMEDNSGFAPTASRDAASLLGVGGCYSPPNANKGMIKFVPPPPWLRNIAFSGHSAMHPIGLDGKRAFSTSTTPKQQNDDGLVANKDGLNREGIIRETSDLYDAYAKYMYATEMLRGRFGTVSGKLRFDIAPGSTVKIGGSAELFLQGQDALAQNLVGTVMRTSFGMNAEASQAGTTFAFTHIRTEEQNKDDRYSVDGHPLFDEGFTGAPLLDALWFKNEGDGCC